MDNPPTQQQGNLPHEEGSQVNHGNSNETRPSAPSSKAAHRRISTEGGDGNKSLKESKRSSSNFPQFMPTESSGTGSKLEQLLTADKKTFRNLALAQAEPEPPAGTGSFHGADDGTNLSVETLAEKYRNPRKRLLMSSLRNDSAEAEQTNSNSSEDASVKARKFMKWRPEDASPSPSLDRGNKSTACLQVAPHVLKKFYPSAVESAECEEFLVSLSEDDSQDTSTAPISDNSGNQKSTTADGNLNRKNDPEHMEAQIEKLLKMPSPGQSWKKPVRQRKFQCATCSKSYSTEDDLKSHELSHSSEDKKIFECEVCHRQFRWRASLKVHKRRLHNYFSEKMVSDGESTESENSPKKETVTTEPKEKVSGAEKKPTRNPLGMFSKSSKVQTGTVKPGRSKSADDKGIRNQVGVKPTSRLLRVAKPLKQQKSVKKGNSNSSNEASQTSVPNPADDVDEASRELSTGRASLRRNIQRPKWLSDADCVTDYEFPRGTSSIRTGSSTSSPSASQSTSSAANGTQVQGRVSIDSTKRIQKTEKSKFPVNSPSVIKSDVKTKNKSPVNNPSVVQSEVKTKSKAQGNIPPVVKSEVKTKSKPPGNIPSVVKHEVITKNKPPGNSSIVKSEPVKPPKLDKAKVVSMLNKEVSSLQKKREDSKETATRKRKFVPTSTKSQLPALQSSSPSKQLSIKILELNLAENVESSPSPRSSRNRQPKVSVVNHTEAAAVAASPENKKIRQKRSRLDEDAGAVSQSSSTEKVKPEKTNVNSMKSSEAHLLEENLPLNTPTPVNDPANSEEDTTNTNACINAINIESADKDITIDTTDAKKLQEAIISNNSDSGVAPPAVSPSEESLMQVESSSGNAVTTYQGVSVCEELTEPTVGSQCDSLNSVIVVTPEINKGNVIAINENHVEDQVPSLSSASISDCNNKIISSVNVETVPNAFESNTTDLDSHHMEVDTQITTSSQTQLHRVNDEEMPILKPETASSVPCSRANSSSERVKSVDEEVSSNSNHSTIQPAPVLSKQTTAAIAGISQADSLKRANLEELPSVEDNVMHPDPRDRSDSLSMRSFGSGSQSEKIKGLEDVKEKEDSDVSENECLVDSDSNDSLMSEFSELAAQVSEKTDGVKFKEDVLRFITTKVSANSMWAIRKELKRLKKEKNYFKFGKLSPLAAGLMHDLFCQSLP